MKRILAWVILLIILASSYWAWQRYAFLLEPLPETDVSGLSIDESKSEPTSTVDNSAINWHSEPLGSSLQASQAIDISFLENDSVDAVASNSNSVDEIALSELISEPQDVESRVADFMGIKPEQLALMKEATGKVICVFDPIGEGGDIAQIMKGFQRIMLDREVKLDIKNMNSERVVIDSFKAGQCDGMAITGMQTRAFVPFSATFEAMGALPSSADVSGILKAISSPELNAFMRKADYEVAAVFPVGNVYAYVNNWEPNKSVQQQLVGKKIGVFDSDAVALEMIRQMGGTPVQVNTTSFAGKFNNGSVDVIFAPSVVYEPMELYRGLGESGKIIQYPLIHLSYQLVIRHQRFPEGFGQILRQAVYKGRGFLMEYAYLTEKRIPEKYWYIPKQKEQKQLQNTLLDAQSKLREAGIYDADMLKLMKQTRCQREPTHSECAGL